MGIQFNKKIQYLYLNKMELGQSFKKRYSRGIKDNCPGAAAIDGTYCVDKAANQKEIYIYIWEYNSKTNFKKSLLK